MPELPELQAHAERLDERYAGATLAALHAAHVHRAEDGGAAAEPTPTATPSSSSAAAASTCCSTSATLTFVVHLMQGGRLKEEPVGKQPAKPRAGRPGGCSTTAARCC